MDKDQRFPASRKFVDPKTGEPIEVLGEKSVADDFKRIRHHIQDMEPHHGVFGTRADPFGLTDDD